MLNSKADHPSDHRSSSRETSIRSDYHAGRVRFFCSRLTELSTLGHARALPLITEWPEAWLNPKTPPIEVIEAWFERLESQGGESPEALTELREILSELTDDERCALIRNVIYRMMGQRDAMVSNLPLVAHLRAAYRDDASPDERAAWARNERVLKGWLREQGVAFIRGVSLSQEPSQELPSQGERDIEPRRAKRRERIPDIFPHPYEPPAGGTAAPRPPSPSPAPPAPSPASSSAPLEVPRPSAQPAAPPQRARASTRSEPDVFGGMPLEGAIPPLPDSTAPDLSGSSLTALDELSRSDESARESAPSMTRAGSLGASLDLDDDLDLDTFITGAPVSAEPEPDAEPPEALEAEFEEELVEEPTEEQLIDVSHPAEPPPTLEERLIDQSMTRPGPLERVIERVRWLSWALYKTLGFATLSLLHIVDNLWEFVSSYITHIFKGWMSVRSAARVAMRRAEGELASGVKEDVKELMSSLELTLCLSHRALGRYDETPLKLSGHYGSPLAHALSARAALDDLRRDLNFIYVGGGGRTFKRALKAWLISLIPNPIELLRPLVNVLLLSLRVRYSRDEVQARYQKLNSALNDLIKDLERAERGLSTDPTDLERSRALIDALQEQLDHWMTLCLQSGYHARPWRWRLLDKLSSINAPAPHKILKPTEHPLALSAQQEALLDVCASIERQPFYGAPLSLNSDVSYQAELDATRQVSRALRRLREAGRV